MRTRQMKPLGLVPRHAIVSMIVLIALHTLTPRADAVMEGDVTGSTSAPSAALLDELKQWTISRPSGAVRLLPKPTFEGPTERNYTLKNKEVRKFLQSETQSLGINLGWTEDAEPATATKVAPWFFTRNGGGDGPLVWRDRRDRSWQEAVLHLPPDSNRGINLAWSDSALQK